jgi:hypothetical protein
MTLLAVFDGAEAGSRNRRRRQSKPGRGLKYGGDAFSWKCAGQDLNNFLDQSTSELLTL